MISEEDFLEGLKSHTAGFIIYLASGVGLKCDKLISHDNNSVMINEKNGTKFLPASAILVYKHSIASIKRITVEN